ncbi:MAG: hypothetical protein LQ342_006405 [Letrouitia transgressa]|nr:MAG: hypothetical protein LQ342_006405 [Letrouitia transgressa]
MNTTAADDPQSHTQPWANEHSSRVLSASTSRSSRETVIPTVECGLDRQDEYQNAFSDSAHQSSSPDEEVVFDNQSHKSSPRTSHHSNDDISELFSESRHSSSVLGQQRSSPYVTLKTKSPFRNPSSVRALQMDTTPPPFLPSSPFHSHSVLTTPSLSGTPRSVRSHHSAMHSPTKKPPNKKVRKEYPLVLLHVTLLPITSYPQEVLRQVLPDYIIENWKILRERATETVLERGILIPHPKEDYDLLEERLLESLDLKSPRILKCGHFHIDPDEDTGIAGSDANRSDAGQDDEDTCEDCGRKVKHGRFGSGSGNGRWDIKIFAANGLMRAGAWSAAWREMERVDVEILPWMDEDMKRELNLRMLEEQQLVENMDSEMIRHCRKETGTDNARIREVYGDDAPPPDFVQLVVNDPANLKFPTQQGGSRDKIPLTELLRSYVLHLVQDRRNIAIFLLSAIVLLLCIRTKSAPTHSLLPTQQVYPTYSSTAIGCGRPSSSIQDQPQPTLEKPIPTNIEPVIPEEHTIVERSREPEAYSHETAASEHESALSTEHTMKEKYQYSDTI